MRRVLIREQAPELGGQGGVSKSDVVEQVHRLLVVLAPAPFAETEPADRIGCGDATQDGKGGCEVRLTAVFGEDEFGDLEKRARLVAAPATLGGRARDDSTGSAGGHRSLRSRSRKRSPCTGMSSARHESTKGSPSWAI